MNDLFFLIPLVIFLMGSGGCLISGFCLWTWGVFKWQTKLDEKILKNLELSEVEKLAHREHQFFYKILRWSALGVVVGLFLLILSGFVWALST